MSDEAIKESNAPVATQCCKQDGGPSCLWNTQVYPYTLGPTQLSAVLWYQGEQNANCGGPTQVAGAVYSTMLQTMVQDWRRKFRQPSLAFGAVLLAAWQSGDVSSFPLLRLAQANLTAHLNDTFLISAIDRGDPSSGAVHSPYKQDVGSRSANGVLATALGKTAVLYKGPTYAYAAATVSRAARGIGGSSSGGDGIVLGASAVAVTVTFGASGGSVVVNNTVACPPNIRASSCEAFAVMSQDCVWHPANASIGGSSTTIGLIPTNWSAGLAPVATRGYFANWPLVQVTNVLGVPAVPWLEYLPRNSNSNSNSKGGGGGGGGGSNGGGEGSSGGRTCSLTPPPPPAPGPQPPAPPPGPCNTTAPNGYVEMPQHGWWDLDKATRHSKVDIAACATMCNAERGCSGFHVWEPCGASDCYIFTGALSGFEQHPNAYAYKKTARY